MCPTLNIIKPLGGSFVGAILGQYHTTLNINNSSAKTGV